MIDKIPEAWRYGLIILAIVLLIVLLGKWAASRSSACGNKSQIAHILKESARWEATSKQDSNIAFALIHINFAIAYANVVRLLMPDDEIQKHTGINIQQFVMKLNDTQQSIMQNLGNLCPNIKPENDYAILTGYLS